MEGNDERIHIRYQHSLSHVKASQLVLRIVMVWVGFFLVIEEPHIIHPMSLLLDTLTLA